MPINDSLNFNSSASLGADQNPQWVILLHGLGRTKRSMNKIRKELARAGYSTINQGYPSTRHDIARLSDRYLRPAVEQCLQQKASKIHLVSHSMGGLLIRQYLQSHTLPPESRIVMLSPPNQGSEVAEFLKNYSIYQWILGPAAQQLGTTDRPYEKYSSIPYEVGIITGNVSSDPWFGKLIPGANDGKVSVERAKLPGMNDFLVIRAGHTRIMQSKLATQQILNFLRFGHFQR